MMANRVKELGNKGKKESHVAEKSAQFREKRD